MSKALPEGHPRKGKMGPPKGEGGRPKKELDFELFEMHVAHRMTLEECAALHRMDKATLIVRIKEHYGPDATFSTVFNEFAPLSKASLRFQIMRRAMQSDRVLIHASRYILGNRDSAQGQGGDPEDEGVMVVPGVLSNEDWEAEAQAQSQNADKS